MSSSAPEASAAAASADHIVIAPMRRRHLRGVLAIEESTNNHPWSMGLFLGELRMPTSRRYLVALDAHRVLGYCGLMFTGAEGHITNIAVDPDLRRRQIGRALLIVMLDQARRVGIEEITLEVRSSNAAAQALYRPFGFAPEGVRRGYYSNPSEDAIIMWAHDVCSPDYGRRLQTLADSMERPLRVRGVGAGGSASSAGATPATRPRSRR